MSDITLEQLIQAGYHVKAAPIDSWRRYDEHNPVPGYFDFDWLSARHPDLYDQFALSTDGLVEELHRLVDLTGLRVVEAGAGTGRAAILTARKARSVTAVDIFEPVIAFGKDRVQRAGVQNVHYLRGDSRCLPLPENTFNAFISSWAAMSFSEAYRVLKPGGYLLLLGSAPGALCGELTAPLADVFPQLITEIAPARVYDPACPVEDFALQGATWNDLPVIPPTLLHDFTFVADYGDAQEAAAVLGRLYGPVARRYVLDRRQATLSWRLRIGIGRVKK